MSDSDELRDELLQAASGKRGRAHFSDSELVGTPVSHKRKSSEMHASTLSAQQEQG